MIMSVGEKFFWVEVSNSRNRTFAFKKYGNVDDVSVEREIWMHSILDSRISNANALESWDKKRGKSFLVYKRIFISESQHHLLILAFF